METRTNALNFSFLFCIIGITISTLPPFLEGYSHEVTSNLLNGSSIRDGIVVSKRNTIKNEFKTLEEDINTVKKLKLMVEMFRRIKRDNPLAYERMVNFFEKNKKARRLRRSFLQELKTFGKKKKMVTALENQLDSAAKCHPKSGKELIQMFVKGLTELYPDMTRMLLSELQGALHEEPPKKTTVGKNATKKTSSPTKAACTTSKNKEEKSSEKDEKGSNKNDKRKDMSQVKDVSNTTSTTAPSSRVTPTMTSCPPCKTAIPYGEQECVHKFADHVKPIDSEDSEIGDIRSHYRTTVRNSHFGKHVSRTPPKKRIGNEEEIKGKRRIGSEEEIRGKTGPFKDFQVQGSICFSNPCRKSAFNQINGLRSGLTSESKASRINRAEMSAGNWKEWFPKEEDDLHELSANPQDINKSPEVQPRSDSGFRHIKSGFGEDKVKGSDSYIALLNRSLEKYSQNAATRATPDNQPKPVNKNAELSIFPDRKRNRNKKRSMYVLYEK